MIDFIVGYTLGLLSPVIYGGFLLWAETKKIYKPRNKAGQDE